MSYRVFYDDKETYDSRDGGNPPARGVQVILQDHPQVGVEAVCECDFYVLRRGRWYGVDKFGLYDYLLDSGIVLFGRTISRAEFHDVMETVNAEKHGWTARERKV